MTANPSLSFLSLSRSLSASLAFFLSVIFRHIAQNRKKKQENINIKYKKVMKPGPELVCDHLQRTPLLLLI